MDKSKQNILMCEKAVEIQKLWILQPGDYFTRSIRENNIYILQNDEYSCIKVGSKTCSPMRESIWIGNKIWLPRQDQLQEMLGCSGVMPRRIIEDLYKFSDTVAFHKTYSPITMEQLWLAFVMKEKFNKVWNGKDWKIS